MQLPAGGEGGIRWATATLNRVARNSETIREEAPTNIKSKRSTAETSLGVGKLRGEEEGEQQQKERTRRGTEVWARRRESGGHVDGQEPVHLDLGSAWVAGRRFSRVSSCLIHSRNKAQGRSTEYASYLLIYLPKTLIKTRCE